MVLLYFTRSPMQKICTRVSALSAMSACLGSLPGPFYPQLFWKFIQKDIWKVVQLVSILCLCYYRYCFSLGVDISIRELKKRNQVIRRKKKRPEGRHTICNFSQENVNIFMHKSRTKHRENREGKDLKQFDRLQLELEHFLRCS